VLVGVGLAVAVGVAVGVDVGVLVGVDVELLLVAYVPLANTVTNTDCTYLTGVLPVPVPPDPFQQPTDHSKVPGWEGLTPPLFIRAPTLPFSVPLNALVTALTAGEMTLTRAPLGLNSASWADVQLLVGHASVVDHVGVALRLPLDGLRDRLPGSDPTPAARAIPAVSSPTPPIMPTAAKSTIPRRTPVAAGLLLIFSSREWPRSSFDAGIALHATT